MYPVGDETKKVDLGYWKEKEEEIGTKRDVDPALACFLTMG
jgi:hypothetical protein